ncbi:BamA/TamA family outer membrane protein [Sphingobacterium bambusae]|uniref:BamA/TamA family outer membrane protein n=1 Tax=Sphingobacterium bambusae TaxID=662858 RepID=A0ABW6BHV8_9SPHI|nr:BamA/TamA family outer membrane protein [Sphingobacterium bambusae]WPL50268.1 BamA/TamA family outer membrane protein [Sphingobacterium bambusae]
MKLTLNFKKILFYALTLFSFSAIPAHAQDSIPTKQDNNLIKKLIKQFLSSENDSSRGGSLIILPAVGYAQESGFEYGVAGTYNFYLDKSDLNSRTSNITLIGTLTTEKQKNIKLTSDIWTKNNDYHILSELRYRDWPFNFYGLGSDTWLADEDFIGQKLIRAKIDVEKRVIPNLYVGANVNYEHFRFDDREAGGVFDQDIVLGKLGGQYLALGVSSLYDTRNNTTYSTKGVYARLKYDYSPNFFGGDNFTGTELEADLRAFKELAPTLTLAGQVVYRGTFGKNVPFYAYRDLGGDMTMRGYYLGRYKDRNYATAQAELRYRFMSRFGIVGFGGTGGTFSPERSLRLVPSYGAGIRYFFSLEHNSTIRFDYAFGEKRPGEQRQKGFYLSISEAF